MTVVDPTQRNYAPKVPPHNLENNENLKVDACVDAAMCQFYRRRTIRRPNRKLANHHDTTTQQ